MYDIAIIGAGPGGYNAAERAAENGLKTIIFEDKHIGGVCLNEGCIPTKTLLQSAKIFDYTKTAKKYGIIVDNSTFEYSKIIRRKKKIVKKLTIGIKNKLLHNNVEIVNSKAVITKLDGDNFIISADEKNYSAKKIIIATGSSPVIPNIKGIETANILTSKDVLEITEIPESITIIGGGVIGMEFASLFNSFGSTVSVIEMLPNLLGNTDSEISEIIKEEYTKKGIKFYLNSKVTEFNKNSVMFENNGEINSIESESILMSIGRKPNIENFGLENINVETERGAIKINEYCETNVKNIFAIGDVNGKSLLAHTAYREAEMVINNIFNKKDSIDYNNIPSVVYTNPEVASVGIDEATAIEKGINISAIKIPMTYSGRFIADNEGFAGLFKLIVNKDNNKIIGINMIGNSSSEIITTATHIVTLGLNVEEAKKVIYPHPTTSEIIREALFEY